MGSRRAYTTGAPRYAHAPRREARWPSPSPNPNPSTNPNPNPNPNRVGRRDGQAARRRVYRTPTQTPNPTPTLNQARWRSCSPTSASPTARSSPTSQRLSWSARSSPPRSCDAHPDGAVRPTEPRTSRSPKPRPHKHLAPFLSAAFPARSSPLFSIPNLDPYPHPHPLTLARTRTRTSGVRGLVAPARVLAATRAQVPGALRLHDHLRSVMLTPDATQGAPTHPQADPHLRPHPTHILTAAQVRARRGPSMLHDAVLELAASELVAQARAQQPHPRMSSCASEAGRRCIDGAEAAGVGGGT